MADVFNNTKFARFCWIESEPFFPIFCLVEGACSSFSTIADLRLARN